ncbi:MAG: efflux RND transporter permease subunit [Nitrospirota bacterium]|nr:efflux RND transporter permease subunit [Nitrospirota bacterium]
MVRGALKNPYLIIAMVLAIVLLGGAVVHRMPVDMLPSFKTPAVLILTLYPGMPAEVMERDITTRLERWTGQANGIARQESKSMIGVSVLKNYFRPDIDPNTAMSQVTSLAMSDLYYMPPGTLPPMVMPFDPTATLPLAILAVSSPALNEKELYDVAYFDLRNRLQGISGVIAPAVYGGKIRRILAYVDRVKLQARGLSTTDVVKAIKESNLMIPTGNAKLGAFDYQIETNAMLSTVKAMNEIPLKSINGQTVFLRDIGEMRDSHQIQSNIIKINGKRQVYIPIYRQPGANTIAVVDSLKESLAGILTRLPEGVSLNLVMDQSVYVRSAIANLFYEGLLGAGLAAIMILLFLGSLRSTVVIMPILPLAALVALTVLYFTGNTINAMTLGGLALVIGKIIDDGIVVLENTTRHLEMGQSPEDAAYHGASEVARPVLAATLTAIVVFLPVSLMTGIGKFLFGPLALTVVVAMVTSYLLAMTAVPVSCARVLQARRSSPDSPMQGSRWHQGFQRQFLHLQTRYTGLVMWALAHRAVVLVAVAGLFIGSMALIPSIGTELFPATDTGQITIKVRGPTGLRIEKTEELIDRIERTLKEEIPPKDLTIMISNIGVLYDWPAAYTPNSGPMDAFILLQLSEHRQRSASDYAASLRPILTQKFPGAQFAFETGGLITAALNFGLPSPINVQVEGNDLHVAHEIGEKIRRLISTVPGAKDVRIQQKLDYPQIEIELDRTKIARLGLTAEHVVKNVIASLNSSVNFDPAFWIDPKNGNHYFVGAQYREEAIDSIQTLQDIPVTGDGQDQAILLRNIARFNFREAPAEVNHLNVTRVIDVYANVEGRDIGGLTQEVKEKIERDIQPSLPSGYFVRVRGEYASMLESFQELGMGFLLAVVLVYLVLLAQFRSFRDPLVIILSVPMGLMGVIGILLLTGTTFNIQSFLGTIFIVGIAVSHGILLIEFAKQREAEGVVRSEAIVQAATIRLRPILMTSLAAILALLPMAIGFGQGAETNIPLARAVVGGLTVSTLLTLLVVPVLYSLIGGQLHRQEEASSFE